MCLLLIGLSVVVLDSNEADGVLFFIALGEAVDCLPRKIAHGNTEALVLPRNGNSFILRRPSTGFDINLKVLTA